MGYGIASNSSHFTGKKRCTKQLRKRRVKEEQTPHKNKYVKYSNCKG